MNPFFEEKDLRIKTARSSGPGGQNVNKRSTKVQVRVPVSKILVSEAQKALVRKKLGTRINKRDELEAESEESRSQDANRDLAVALLRKLITGAIKVPKKRIPTKISRNAEAKFREERKKESEKKQLRKFLPHEWLE